MNPLASFELDYNSGLPVWIQVKNRIAYLIGSGEYKAGDQLPTVRSLAVDLDISYNTVIRTCANAGMDDDDILALVQARLAQKSLTRA